MQDLPKEPIKEIENYKHNGRIFSCFPKKVNNSVVPFKNAHHFIAHLSLLPPKVELRDKMDSIYDQGSIGSCTTNAVCSCMRYINRKFSPSRLFLYYNVRKQYGEEGQDTGSSIFDNIDSAAKQGICLEVSWSYDTTKFTQQPPANCYEEALSYQLLQWSQLVRNLESMKACLSAGFPFVIGISCYQSLFNADKSPYIVNLPAPTEKQLGGHAVVICGYDDDKKLFTLKNSWGESWGDHGYCYIPYDYLTNKDLAWDLWTLRKMEEEEKPIPVPTPISTASNIYVITSAINTGTTDKNITATKNFITELRKVEPKSRVILVEASKITDEQIKQFDGYVLQVLNLSKEGVISKIKGKGKSTALVTPQSDDENYMFLRALMFLIRTNQKFDSVIRVTGTYKMTSDTNNGLDWKNKGIVEVKKQDLWQYYTNMFNNILIRAL